LWLVKCQKKLFMLDLVFFLMAVVLTVAARLQTTSTVSLSQASRKLTENLLWILQLTFPTQRGFSHTICSDNFTFFFASFGPYAQSTRQSNYSHHFIKIQRPGFILTYGCYFFGKCGIHTRILWIVCDKPGYSCEFRASVIGFILGLWNPSSLYNMRAIREVTSVYFRQLM
jgi:hypothetical protein